VYLQTTRHIYLLLSERVNRTCVRRSKKTSTTGHTTTCHLAPIGFQGATLFQLWNRSGRPAVLTEMNDGSVNQSSATRVWIPIGAGLFLIALAPSSSKLPESRIIGNYNFGALVKGRGVLSGLRLGAKGQVGSKIVAPGRVAGGAAAAVHAIYSLRKMSSSVCMPLRMSFCSGCILR